MGTNAGINCFTLPVQLVDLSVKPDVCDVSDVQTKQPSLQSIIGSAFEGHQLDPMLREPEAKRQRRISPSPVTRFQRNLAERLDRAAHAERCRPTLQAMASACCSFSENMIWDA